MLQGALGLRRNNINLKNKVLLNTEKKTTNNPPITQFLENAVLYKTVL